MGTEYRGFEKLLTNGIPIEQKERLLNMQDTIHIQGYKAKIISRNYQNGQVTFEFDHAVPPGYTVVNIMTFEQLEKVRDPDLIAGYWGGMDFGGDINSPLRCTCGNDSLAAGNKGKHSTWCDKYSKWSDQ
jgi:hypothetical protein